MTENKRFTLTDTTKITKHSLLTGINDTNRQLTVSELVDCLNTLHEENIALRSKHTQSIILLKDIINDLKRIDTKGYAEHIEKIENINFLSRGLNND